MRPSAVLVCATLLLVPAAASAQSATTPEFHKGQWAAQFALEGGFSGFGALHFSSPERALALQARIGTSLSDYSGSNSSSNSQNFSLAIGRRTYRAGSGRVRPYHEIGLSTGFGRTHSVSGSNTQTSLGTGLGVYGSLGATIFFAPELSLGASVNAGAGANYNVSYTNGAKNGSTTYFSLSGGSVGLEGAFYF